MNTNEETDLRWGERPREPSAAELRGAAVVAMIENIKENLLLAAPQHLGGGGPAAPGQEAGRAERRLATLKLAMQALETLPADKPVERAMRSLQRAIHEQQKWKAECERKPS